MNKKNIIVGAARTFLGPALNTADATTETEIADAILAWRPDAVANESYSTTLAGATGTGAGWKGVGYTQDGLEVATDPSWGEVEVDQLLDSAKIFKDGMGLTISTTFAEATLENLLIAWGQEAPEGFDPTATEKQIDIDGGALGEAPYERGLIAVGNATEVGAGNAYGERTYFAYRVLSVDASTHSLSRAEATTIPVSFRALPADNGKYGSVRDRLNIVPGGAGDGTEGGGENTTTPPDLLQATEPTKSTSDAKARKTATSDEEKKS